MDIDLVASTKEGDGFAGTLSEPFPHSAAWNLPEARLMPHDSFENDEEEEAWIQEIDREVWSSELVNGAFPICHQGCAIRNLLIVTGPDRGNVWVDDRASDGGIFPGRSNRQSGMPFFEWYSTWLDDSIAAREPGQSTADRVVLAATSRPGMSSRMTAFDPKARYTSANHHLVYSL